MALTNLTKGTVVGSEGGSATTNLAQGLGKAWWHVSNMVLLDSFNSSSITDNAAGNLTVTCSSAMGNDDYCIPMGADGSAGTDASIRVIDGISGTTAKTTTAYRCRFGYYTTEMNELDTTAISVCFLGDLA